MSPEERDMIEGVFDRMRSVGRVDKDRDAEALINASVRKIPDSAYMLVQSVLVQQNALEQAEQRIQELEENVAQLEAQQQRSQPAPASSGGFLGGLFGGSKPTLAPEPKSSPWGGSSVPQVGRQSTGYAGPPQGGYNQAPIQQAPPPAAGGGFMRSAMTTAAGVAGGVLVAGAIGNMMRGHGETGGHQSTSGTSSTSGSGDQGFTDASTNDQGGTYAQPLEQPQYTTADDNDQGGPAQGGVQDAGYDDGGSDWGGGSDDIET